MKAEISDPHAVGLEIIAKLENHGFKARFVGGCVRDHLLNLQPKDYDIATSALPEQCQKILADERTKIIPTGLQHGTVSAIRNKVSFEITTLRSDVHTDGRHAEVEYTDSFEEDAHRRDFTINAMSMDSKGQIFDYFNGKTDLQEKRLRFVGNGKERIQEDYLRILRYFRFGARFQLGMDSYDLEAIEQLAAGLQRVSKERIRSELQQLFSQTDISNYLKTMLETKVWHHLIDFQGSKEEVFPGWVGMLASSPNNLPWSRWVLFALYCNHHPKLSAKNWQLFHFSRSEFKQLEAVIYFWQIFKNGHEAQQGDLFKQINKLEEACGKFAFRHWVSSVIKIHCKVFYPDLTPHLMHIESLNEKKEHLRTAQLPLSATDVMQALNIPQGPQVGKALEELQRSYWNEVWSTKKAGIKYLKDKFLKN